MYTMGMTGRKWEIFLVAVRLFSDNTFEGVSVRDIAHEVGLQPGSLYAHFDSKEELLDTIYTYLEQFYAQEGMPSQSGRLERANDGPLEELIYQYWFWPEDMQDILRRILRIVLTRMHFEPRARELFHATAINWAYNIDEPVLKKLVALGRIDDFDLEAYLVLKVALDVYATLRFSQDDTLPTELWMRAGRLLMDKIILDK